MTTLPKPNWHFDGRVRLTPKGWLVYQYDLGATDVPWIGWWDYYPVPREVFPGQ